MPRGAVAVDITGQRFGRLVVVERRGSNRDRKAVWLARCDCGGSREVTGRGLRVGTSSCGCIKREQMRHLGLANTTHGMTNTPEWRTWHGMIQRTTNPNDKGFAYYGARGISVCEHWMTFENFFADMGERPADMTSIDRIDNNGNYEPGNCRWANATMQNNNKRPGGRWRK